MSVYDPSFNIREENFNSQRGREQIINELETHLKKIAECLKTLDIEDNFTEQAKKDLKGYTGSFKDKDGHNVYVKNGKIEKIS